MSGDEVTVSGAVTLSPPIPALLVVVELEATEPRFYLYARSPQDEDALRGRLARGQDELAARLAAGLLDAIGLEEAA
jgi:hypothetical protein